MRVNRKGLLAAGLLAGVMTMTGCTATVRPAATSTPQTAQQQTAQPETAQASPDMTAETEETPEPISLYAGEKEAAAKAVKENGDLQLPLQATAQLLGWEVKENKTEEETQTRHEIALEKEESRITVSYQVSDNTIRQISWQKDGLLIPVDTRIRMIDDIVYVPAAFFEEAMGIKLAEHTDRVELSSSEPMDSL